LGVNIDHVATIRQARRTFEPDPVTAAALATLGGAEVITGHLREDRRHLNDRDLNLLKETVFSKLNLEMSVAPSIVTLACKVKPDEVTLVPEKRNEVTTEGGLDVRKGGSNLARAVAKLKKRGVVVSLFIDPDPAQIHAAVDVGAHTVELHTGSYANARTERAVAHELRTLVKASALAGELGLKLNAGHGLTYQNIRGIVENLDIEELHIGHSIVSRAVLVGMERATRDMVELISRYDALG
jgi:pyridoxine 5-phosphate synthase